MTGTTALSPGALTVSSESYTMAMDRGRAFQLDREDNDETGIADLAGQVMSEFVRTKVVPEMDAYVLSKLAALAVSKSQTVTGTPASQAYKMITEAINKVQAIAGYSEPLVCFVDSTVWVALMNTAEVDRQIDVGDFRKGTVNTRVKFLNDVPILPVADDRMKTAFTFYDGVTSTDSVDQTAGGFVPASGAKKIGILVLPKRAASLVKKAERVRTFSPTATRAPTPISSSTGCITICSSKSPWPTQFTPTSTEPASYSENLTAGKGPRAGDIPCARPRYVFSMAREPQRGTTNSLTIRRYRVIIRTYVLSDPGGLGKDVAV